MATPAESAEHARLRSRTSRRQQQRPSRAVRLGAQAAVLLLAAGGTTAFVGLHKTVTVEVDGQQVEVNAFGRTVGQVLASGDITVGEHDLVAPGLGEQIRDGAEIVVRHGRQIDVEVDGRQQTVWTTALTVGEAVDDLGLREGNTLTSASRSAAVTRDDVLRVSTQKTIHLAVDGQVIDGVTSSGTVRDALRDIGLVLNEGDHVSVPLDATATDGLVVMVTRAATTGETVTEAIPFEEQEVEDPTLVKGTRQVDTPGRAGVRTTTYSTAVVGGAVVERQIIASAVTTEPVTQIVKVGTLEISADVSVTPGSAQELGKQMAAARGWGDDQFSCLLQLWNKESGWRVNAENRSSGAYGIPQALPGSKMASVAADWRTNPATQITWGLNYIAGRYSTPCGAWSASQAKGWY
ncbi:ubiquitin-like domain-containing protein [Cellulomonas sp. NPDC089187]|uniref:aggregation-promoting factor C-terminal-like domain-containing protein n=1 Tax=Cellulomonas sp. NPDC089187 TaxID=3154970 RepID=UPI00344250FE